MLIAKQINIKTTQPSEHDRPSNNKSLPHNTISTHAEATQATNAPFQYLEAEAGFLLLA
jgi:hypothetical protein